MIQFKDNDLPEDSSDTMADEMSSDGTEKTIVAQARD